MAVDETTVQAYRRAFEGLLPKGVAWTQRAKDGPRGKLISAIGAEAAALCARAQDLLRESDPRTTAELISEWEAFLALPDPAEGASVERSLEQRRDAVINRLVAIQGQSVGFFIELAARYGFVITITEYKSAHVGPNAGDPDIWNDGYANKIGDALWEANDGVSAGSGWEWHWQVNAPLHSIIYAGIGDEIGDALATWGNAILEAVIRRAKPAHTSVGFAYIDLLTPSGIGSAESFGTVTIT